MSYLLLIIKSILDAKNHRKNDFIIKRIFTQTQSTGLIDRITINTQGAAALGGTKTPTKNYLHVNCFFIFFQIIPVLLDPKEDYVWCFSLLLVLNMLQAECNYRT